MQATCTRHSRALSVVVCSLLAAGTGGAQTQPSVDVRIVLDEAETALRLLRPARDSGDQDWSQLWETEGFLRFEARQLAFGGTETRVRLREYLESEEARAKVELLEAALDQWRSIDLGAAAARARAYLPPGTPLQATIFPLVKRATNSFVHDLDVDPAIFIYINPERSRGELENTLAHELHHVGSVLGCAEPRGSEALKVGAAAALSWMSGFGEGIATLAAAGGPGVHPHASGTTRAWAIWERDAARFADDVGRLGSFFAALSEERLESDAATAVGMEFINTDDVPQGAFYTVGWRMAALVERTYGRARVIEGVCDPRALLSSYNEAVVANGLGGDARWPLWSTGLLLAVQGRG